MKGLLDQPQVTGGGFCAISEGFANVPVSGNGVFIEVSGDCRLDLI